MSLRLRYATFLLSILLLLVCASAVSVYLLLHGRYVLTVLLFLALFMLTFKLGKRFSKVFFILSTLKFLKMNNGVVSIDKFNGYIDTILGSRKGYSEKSELKVEILTTLETDGAIEIRENTIVLTAPLH